MTFTATARISTPEDIYFRLFGVKVLPVDLWATCKGKGWETPQTWSDPADAGFEPDEYEVVEFFVEIPLVRRILGNHMHDAFAIWLGKTSRAAFAVQQMVEENAHDWGWGDIELDDHSQY